MGRICSVLDQVGLEICLGYDAFFSFSSFARHLRSFPLYLLVLNVDLTSEYEADFDVGSGRAEECEDFRRIQVLLRDVDFLDRVRRGAADLAVLLRLVQVEQTL